MSNLTGKVVQINFDFQAEKKAGGTYNAWRLIYEDSQGQIKNVTKPMGSLQYAPALANGLRELSPGDSFTMERVEKDGFQNPTKIYKSQGNAGGHTNATAPTQQAKPQAASSGGNWPTADERKATQTHIIRQNSMSNAVAFVAAVGDKKATPQQAITIAKQFEAFVLGKDSMEDLQNDLPFDDDMDV